MINLTEVYLSTRVRWYPVTCVACTMWRQLSKAFSPTEGTHQILSANPSSDIFIWLMFKHFVHLWFIHFLWVVSSFRRFFFSRFPGTPSGWLSDYEFTLWRCFGLGEQNVWTAKQWDTVPTRKPRWYVIL